jgi:MFS family permease
LHTNPISIKSIHPNIYRLYLIKIAKWFMLYMPIVVPFYVSNGLTMKDIMVLQAIYSIAIVILEIPSGYLADVIGRRKTLILGAVFGTIGFATYSFSYGFLGFLIAEVILGIGQSCISGADSAMLYDSLLERGEEKNIPALKEELFHLEIWLRQRPELLAACWQE